MPPVPPVAAGVGRPQEGVPGKALSDIAENTGVNVVLDPRAEKKAVPR